MVFGMNKLPKMAVIREGKMPPDSRTPLIPEQVARLREQGCDLIVQSSPGRAFTDEEYTKLGIPVVEDISDRALLLGIKEVPIDELLPHKTYCYFAHVAKEQPYNQALLRAMLDRNVTHIDYEYLTDGRGRRLIAFGYWAGMVGAHNALWTYGKRQSKLAGNNKADRSLLELPRLKDLYDYAEAQTYYARLRLPDELRVVLTGTGRVGQGAARVLIDMGLRQVSPAEFLEQPAGPVFTQLAVEDYVSHPSGRAVDRRHFYTHGAEYVSAFAPYAAAADIFINGIFWDGRAPAFFTASEMTEPAFRIRTIADITCDIAPASSVPSTLRPSTIAEPVYGFDPGNNAETEAYQAGVIDVMAIDNLPSELPRDASEAFGATFIEKILPEFGQSESEILRRAMITEEGKLGPYFTYLADYAGSTAQT